MWVRENAYRKGEANMTATSFCQWVNNDLLPSYHLSPNLPRTISVRTATRWLHKLGFRPQLHKKAVYVDGHERDVVKSRDKFLKKLKGLKETHLPPPPHAVMKELPHLHRMPRCEKSWSLYIMMRASSTPMKDKCGCGQGKMHQLYSQRQRALALW